MVMACGFREASQGRELERHMVATARAAGVRILGPKTIELMTSNAVGTLFNEGKAGFGLGFEIVDTVGAVELPGSPGTFSWGGAYHTSYWADPKEKIVAVLMTQTPNNEIRGDFENAVMYALVGGGAPASGTN